VTSGLSRPVLTTPYIGHFPGPLLRFEKGQLVVVHAYDETDTPGLVHWHGQMVGNGTAEEGARFVAHEMRRIAPIPKPAGFGFIPACRGRRRPSTGPRPDRTLCMWTAATKLLSRRRKHARDNGNTSTAYELDPVVAVSVFAGQRP
jgi:hypothetical protein